MSELGDAVDAIAKEHDFSGVVRVDRGEQTELAKAYGFAHRGWEIANTVDTRFGVASGNKGFTALVVVSLIEEGKLELSTTARSVLGEDLPLIADDVTLEHLLSHRSGIGDYLHEDEDDDLNDYLMPVPVHTLVETENFVVALDGYPTAFKAGERFEYNNGAFMVLALIAERASGVPYHDLVRDRVCAPARMVDTEFLRSDELPGRAALGYLDIDGVSRTNIFHLPLRGNGDGGAYTTVADVSAFWEAFFDGRIVSREWVAEMVKPRSDAPDDGMRYGLGFWLHQSNAVVELLGADSGVSFRSAHDPDAKVTHTVISNVTDGAWPIARYLRETLTGG